MVTRRGLIGMPSTSTGDAGSDAAVCLGLAALRGVLVDIDEHDAALPAEVAVARDLVLLLHEQG